MGNSGMEDNNKESECEVEVKQEELVVEGSLFKITEKHTGDGEAVDTATRDFKEIGWNVNGHNAMLVIRSKGQPMLAVRRTFTSAMRAEGEAPYAVLFTMDRNSGPLLPAFCPDVETTTASMIWRVKDVWFEGVVDECLKELIGVLRLNYTVGIAREFKVTNNTFKGDSQMNMWGKHALVDNEKGSAHTHVECPRLKAKNKTCAKWELQPLTWINRFLLQVNKPIKKPIEVRIEELEMHVMRLEGQVVGLFLNKA
ncbi:uncharacterized protein BXZ73DRAFT_75472 [Epithele typhae]|uniref:uncharacterized protein n=1 Tax=Epithele typhae TaxID=378194 RepID=UPI00200757E2|nr:uncharacterized protein BXZ73DRAFT_75472 [Epithele typhae]KAH9940348.1 hypothetical protein BXZ73DRAFT_75472 [Epithele typhae]